MKKKALILGMGKSGRASASFLVTRGYEVIGLDENIERLSSMQEIRDLEKIGVYVFSSKDPVNISSFDEIIISPGIPSNDPLLIEAKSCHIPILGEVELAFRNIRNHRCVGITGTNGKTTVTLLVTHILNQCGYKARSLGNIGNPITENVDSLEPGEIVVAELSSYQLETLTAKVFDAAVLLNVTPDHLDRYKNMEEYAGAKCRLQDCLKDQAPFFVFNEASKEFGHLLSKHYTTFGDDISSQYWSNGEMVKEFDHFEFFLPSQYHQMPRHDIMNILSAWCLCKTLGIEANAFLSAIQTFTKPLHRLEFVKSIHGVEFYDDSKGTNIDSVIQAVKAMKGPVYLIAGGVDKGVSYTTWKDPFTRRVKEIIALGMAAEKIYKELGSFFKVTIVNSMEEAVLKAASSAVSGEKVLLSPGCSSFDMFRDYAHRGIEFQRCVNQLEERNQLL